MVKCLFPIGLHNVELSSETIGAAPHTDLVDILDRRRKITDETGVPLDSDRTNPPEELDFEYAVCPFKESPTRYPDGEPSDTPVSNLERRRLAQSYPQIARQLLATRSAYMSLIGLPENRRLTADEGLNILSVMQYLPTYVTERATDQKPVEGFLPQHIIVGANFASGATGAVGAYVQGEIRLMLPSGAVLLDAAESEPSGGLVGPKTVCAASPRMIRQSLDLLVSGNKSLAHGTLEEETAGLLSDKELPAALIVGANLESVLAYNDTASEADRACVEALARYNPKKHNPRRVQAALRDFEAGLEFFVNGYRNISMHTNIALGRAATRPGEFGNILENPAYPFATPIAAKTKGLKLSV